MRKKVVLALLLLLIISCVDRDLATVEPKTGTFVATEIQQVEKTKVDILVVVDNSNSMLEEQNNLANNFPELINELLNPTLDLDGDGKADAVPVEDLHIGVISTDLGTDGQTVQGCSQYGDQGMLLNRPSPHIAGCGNENLPRIMAYPGVDKGQLARQFQCIAVLGTGGCGIEHQLEATRKALVDLTKPGQPNEGFLRDDAILAIIIVSDEDDCSIRDYTLLSNSVSGGPNVKCYMTEYWDRYLYPIDRFERDIKGLKRNVDDIVVALIVGVPLNWDGTISQLRNMLEIQGNEVAASCETALGKAYPPVRLVDFALRFGENQIVQSICVQDWRPAILAITRKIQAQVKGKCLEREVKEEAGCYIVVRNPKGSEEQLDPQLCEVVTEETDPNTGITYDLCKMKEASFEDSNGNHILDPGETITQEGWYYIPPEFNTEGSCARKAEIRFTERAVPPSGSITHLECPTVLCPRNRICPNATDNAVDGCCKEGFYCSREGRCVENRS